MGLELIKCERKYWDFVLELRNSLREGFIDQETIQVKDHYKYMQSLFTSRRWTLNALLHETAKIG